MAETQSAKLAARCLTGLRPGKTISSVSSSGGRLPSSQPWSQAASSPSSQSAYYAVGKDWGRVAAVESASASSS